MCCLNEAATFRLPQLLLLNDAATIYLQPQENVLTSLETIGNSVTMIFILVNNEFVCVHKEFMFAKLETNSSLGTTTGCSGEGPLMTKLDGEQSLQGNIFDERQGATFDKRYSPGILQL